MLSEGLGRGSGGGGDWRAPGPPRVLRACVPRCDAHTDGASETCARTERERPRDVHAHTSRSCTTLKNCVCSLI